MDYNAKNFDLYSYNTKFYNDTPSKKSEDSRYFRCKHTFAKVRYDYFPSRGYYSSYDGYSYLGGSTVYDFRPVDVEFYKNTVYEYRDGSMHVGTNYMDIDEKELSEHFEEVKFKIDDVLLKKSKKKGTYIIIEPYNMDEYGNIAYFVSLTIIRTVGGEPRRYTSSTIHTNQVEALRTVCKSVRNQSLVQSDLALAIKRNLRKDYGNEYR